MPLFPRPSVIGPFHPADTILRVSHGVGVLRLVSAAPNINEGIDITTNGVIPAHLNIGEDPIKRMNDIRPYSPELMTDIRLGTAGMAAPSSDFCTECLVQFRN
jgi:hypothetical protein